LAENEYDDSIEHYVTEIVPCITKFPLKGSDAPFKFLIKSIRGEFIDPNHIVLYLRFKVQKKGDGGQLINIANGENVAPYNGFLYTMFKVSSLTIDPCYVS
jgi:hypothetical protein